MSIRTSREVIKKQRNDSSNPCRTLSPLVGTRFTSLLTLLFTFFGGRIANCNSNLGEGLKTPLSVVWQWAGDPSSGKFKGPVLAEDRLILCGESRVYALSCINGNELWRYPERDPSKDFFLWSPIIVGDRVYIASAKNKIFCIDRLNGKLVWEYNCHKPILSPPVIAGHYLVIGLFDSSLAAIQLESGAPVWRTPHRIFEGLYGQLSASENKVYGLTRRGELFSINVVTREVQSLYSFNQFSVDSKPVIFGGSIYVANSSLLTALDLRSGQVLWQQHLGERAMGSPSVSSHGVAITTESGKLFAFDLAGRALGSSFSVGTSSGISLAWAGPYIVIFDSRQVIQLIEPPKSKLLWTYAAKQESRDKIDNRSNWITNFVPTAPAVSSGDFLYAFSPGNGLIAFGHRKTHDKTPPRVKMLFPNEGDTIPTSGKIDLIFQLSDESSGINPDSIQVLAEGEILKKGYYLEGRLVVSFGGEDKNHVLSNGRKVLTVVSSDWMGNESRHSFVIFVDNALQVVAF